jgi:GntR family transcriptional regulator/MocR family aminotransferase
LELTKPIAPLWNTLVLNRSAAATLQAQIIAYFREAILKGRMQPGSRIPSSRMLSEEYGIARVTVTQAYDQLTAEGYLLARHGAGFFVSESLARESRLTLRPRDDDTGRAKAPVPKRIVGLQQILDRPRQPFALSLGMPAVEAFPWTKWARITQKVYRSHRDEMLCYGDPCGAHELRAAISQYMATARGIDCTPEQVIIVSGSQQGLNLAASALADRDEKIWVEEPGYPMARAAFEAALLEPVPIPVDSEGIDVAAGMAAAPFARVALVSPSYQYPLGVTLSLPRRLALLEWAEASDAWIIEDDYVGEFRYTGAPLPPLYALDRRSRVLYLGTFSKTLAPALRQGFIIVPPQLVERVKRLKLISDRQTPVLDQHVLPR